MVNMENSPSKKRPVKLYPPEFPSHPLTKRKNYFTKILTSSLESLNCLVELRIASENIFTMHPPESFFQIIDTDHHDIKTTIELFFDLSNPFDKINNELSLDKVANLSFRDPVNC